MGSSTSSTGAVDRVARARAIRARWPADRPNPSSPSGVDERVGEPGDEPLEADEAQGVPERLVVGVVAEGQGVAQGAGRAGTGAG